MGLDYFRNLSSHAEQEYAFDSQLQIAATTGKPVFLHQRDAHQAFVAILKNHLPSLSGGVAHCFTGTKEQMHAYLDMGLHIGITGWICDERRGGSLRALVRDIPLDRILVETDAPYLLPRDLSPRPKSRRNEPCHLPHIVEVIAECVGVQPEVIVRYSTENAQRFFRLSQAETPGLG